MALKIQTALSELDSSIQRSKFSSAANPSNENLVGKAISSAIFSRAAGKLLPNSREKGAE